MANLDEIRSVFSYIKSVPKWEKFKDSENQLSLWHNALKDCEGWILRDAAKELVLELKFMIDISEVYKRCLEKSGGSFHTRYADTTNFEREIWRTNRRKDGLVPVKIEFEDDLGNETSEIAWLKKDLCIKHNGYWMQKIDYCMEVLGVEAVTEIIKSDCGIKSVDDLGRQTMVSRYPRVLNEMVRLANGEA